VGRLRSPRLQPPIRVVRMLFAERTLLHPHDRELSAILRNMSPTNTERSNCQFVVQQTADGKVVVVLQLLHETISSLKNSVVGFDLLGGTWAEQAKKLADHLNEYVLGVFVTVKESGASS